MKKKIAMLLAAWYHTIFGVLFAFLCVLLVGVILLQRGRGGGLSGAFGGVGGAASTAFGSKTGDMLTWITVGMAIVFLLFAVGLNYMFRPPATPGIGAPLVAPPTPTPTVPAPISTPAPSSPAPTIPAPASSSPVVPADETPAPAAETTAPETETTTTPAPSEEGTWLMPAMPPVAAMQIFGADAI